LDYFLARYYSSALAKFMSVDPSIASAKAVQPQSWNRYSYTINNPSNYVDPDGLDWWYQTGGTSAAPQWFDTDPGEGYARWTSVASYVYQDVNGTWWALNPSREEAQSSSTPEEALGRFAGFVRGGGISASIADVEFAAGVLSGSSPLGFIQDKLNAKAGLDTSSRDYRTGQLAGILLAAGVSVSRGVLRELTASSASVAAAEKALKKGATWVEVKNADEAAEVYLRNYHGHGYRNTTGMTAKEARNEFGKKGTYHWDLKDTQHGGTPHLQVHTHDGSIIRIAWKIGG
jgi:hypothetical protein